VQPPSGGSTACSTTVLWPSPTLINR
ncbi:hypothetical protein A2U01_0115123, partial [Trifolium medium]|nr:hypothetical protein [Trifolium medium]